MGNLFRTGYTDRACNTTKAPARRAALGRSSPRQERKLGIVNRPSIDAPAAIRDKLVRRSGAVTAETSLSKTAWERNREDTSHSVVGLRGLARIGHLPNIQANPRASW
jgi:hypothetical protein